MSRTAGQPSSSPSTIVRTLTVALAAVVVLCLAVLGFLFFTDTDESNGVGDRLTSLVSGEGRDPGDATAVSSRDRDLVAKQAQQFMLRSNTYGPGDLDEQNQLPEYAERVRAVITAKQSAEFDKNLPLAVQTVAQAGYGRTCQVVAAGVESIGSDQAVALVAGQIVSSYPDPQNVKKRIQDIPRQFRIKVTLRKVEGTWLVDTFQPVTGDVESPAVPGGGATDQPTAPAPSVPSSPTTGSTP